MITQEDISYQQAKERVKKIKGFYTHALVYLIINTMLFIGNIQKIGVNESIFVLKNFSVAILWGIGLMAHGLSVFLPGFLLGKNWEERKIIELMEKEKHQNERIKTK